VVAALALMWLGPGALGARAANVTTDCANLQNALDNAASGDTVTLNQLCNTTNSGGPFPGTFHLDNGPSDSRSYTLEGQPGSGAGFDGTGAGGRMLSATGASSSPASLTLRNLAFENGSQPSSGGAVAFQGEYSVTLDHDTFTNNQAPPGPGGAVDVETTAASATVTLTNDTFTGNQAPSGGPGLGGAVDIATAGTSGTITLDGDTFTNNSAGVGGGAVEVNSFAPSGSLNVSNSTFHNNTANLDTGGALDLCECGGPLPVNLSHNSFSGNQIISGACGCTLEGGALFLDNSSGAIATLTQTGDAFSGNSLTGGSGDVEGGAEAASGFTLSSTSDTFSGNSIRAPASGQVSQGAALSLENDCSTPVPQHTVTNTAIAGNSISDGGLGASAQGAVNIHCAASTANPNPLLLRNATISGNRGGGGTAGVWGEAQDQLTAQNSIVAGNADSAELAGFDGPGGSVNATFTDLCTGTSPFPGTGNICADPALVGANSGDVHETASSPTIDAGSNSLVPNGLTTDVYGVARIQPRVSGGPPIVDMGAAEFPSVAASPTLSTTASAGVVLGGSVNDTATLSGGSTPTGQITFSLYDRNDQSCSGPPIFTDTKAVSGNGDYQSAGFTPTGIGTYRWTASYSGDADNNPASTACNDANESATVTAPLVSGMQLDPDRFAASDKPTPLGPPLPKGILGPPPKGSAIELTLDAPALVHFFVRRKGAPPPSHHRKRHGFNRQLVAGPNSIPFTGNLYGHKLRPGKYTLFARPVSSNSGRRFKRVSAPFTIVAG
jgi:hypothetical protein